VIQQPPGYRARIASGLDLTGSVQATDKTVRVPNLETGLRTKSNHRILTNEDIINEKQESANRQRKH